MTMHGKSTLPRRATLAALVANAQAAITAGDIRLADGYLKLALRWLDVPESEIRAVQDRVAALRVPMGEPLGKAAVQ